MAATQVRNERWERLNALFDFYKIDRQASTKWAELALELALQHVPGMSVSRAHRVGRPSCWDINSMRKLVETVQAVQRTRRIPISAAIKAVQKNDPLYKNLTGLERRYYEAKRKVASADEAQSKWEAHFPNLRARLTVRKPNS